MLRLKDQNVFRRTSDRQRDIIPHKLRTQFLDDLASLMGCKEVFFRHFPDGTRPDVLKADSRSHTLFVGDAKHTETPGCKATQARLQVYLRWLSIFINSHGGTGVFAICFGKTADTEGWIKTITMLANEAGLMFSSGGNQQFDKGLLLVWIVFNGSRHKNY
jgi:hypothetical protein